MAHQNGPRYASNDAKGQDRITGTLEGGDGGEGEGLYSRKSGEPQRKGPGERKEGSRKSSPNEEESAIQDRELQKKSLLGK